MASAVSATVGADRLLSAREVAATLGVSTRQVWKLCASDRLPGAVRLARSVRWRVSDIDLFVKLGCPAREAFEAARAAGTRP